MMSYEIKRQVFFSFHFKLDLFRANQVRNMGQVSKDSTFSGNEWEEVKEKTDYRIKNWIDNQMDKRSCIVVLVGEETYNRKWVKYEIEKAMELNKGIVGIYIHNLKDILGKQSKQGKNPFDYIYTSKGEQLSKYVECYNPIYNSSKFVYSDIEEKITTLIENAIKNRNTY